MKVAVYYNNHDIRIEERPVPTIHDGEILIKVRASGICGTDVMEWYRIKKSPRVLGHEIAGEIAESKSSKFHKGQRVFVSHHVPCNKCKFCLEGNHTACETLHNGNYDPGGYSEYIRVPKINVESGTYTLPENVSYAEATMVEPLACSIRALKLLNIKKGHTVLVLGSGISGLLNISFAKYLGAYVVATDINDFRLEKAKEYGADRVINATENIDFKADRIIVCTGAKSAVDTAFKCVERKGIILFFAIPSTNVEIPIVDVWRNELTITSSYGAAPIDLQEALILISERKINVGDMITHNLPLVNIQKGFNIVLEAKNSLKVVLVP